MDQASTGPKALELATDAVYDLILLDLGLPGLDGLQVAAKLRERGVDAKLFALTGHGSDSDRRRCFEAGFDEHLVKPVDPEVILELLEAHSA
ncbi:MAG: response regulator [Myxococcales bacterium]|nr:response regulator [Myxococcales bacterium]